MSFEERVITLASCPIVSAEGTVGRNLSETQLLLSTTNDMRGMMPETLTTEQVLSPSNTALSVTWEKFTLGNKLLRHHTCLLQGHPHTNNILSIHFILVWSHYSLRRD